jgi:hypothetical protein
LPVLDLTDNEFKKKERKRGRERERNRVDVENYRAHLAIRG